MPTWCVCSTQLCHYQKGWCNSYWSLKVTNIKTLVFSLSFWRQLIREGGRFRKKLANIDQKLGLGEGGSVKVDIHKMKEILEEENSENTKKPAKYLSRFLSLAISNSAPFQVHPTKSFRQYKSTLSVRVRTKLFFI